MENMLPRFSSYCSTTGTPNAFPKGPLDQRPFMVYDNYLGVEAFRVCGFRASGLGCRVYGVG